MSIPQNGDIRKGVRDDGTMWIAVRTTDRERPVLCVYPNVRLDFGSVVGADRFVVGSVRSMYFEELQLFSCIAAMPVEWQQEFAYELGCFVGGKFAKIHDRAFAWFFVVKGGVDESTKVKDRVD